MRPDRWQEIDRICHMALEMEPCKRRVFLDEACAEDGLLREEVEALLTQQEAAERFMATPAIEVAAKVLARDPALEAALDLEGTRLLHYQIEEKIGEGGMGVVYRARDEHLQRDVAVKVLPSGTLADKSARKRFRREALALSRLNHPNIETVYDFDAQDGIDFLVTEFIPGVTLSKQLVPGPPPEKEVIGIGLQIAAALEEAHEKGVVHRDLKPANIMLTAKKQVKILDFGLAKLLGPEGEAVGTDTLSELHTLAGTFPYMAPEQLRGEKVDARTDIHALGIVLYEMCSGSRPFQEDTVPKLTDAILHRAPLAPHTLNAELSPRLEEIILKCLEKDPENRFQSAKELLVDLRQLEISGFVPAGRGAERKRDRRRLALVTGALLVPLLIALGLWLSHEKPTLAFSNRDWILISDFENLTGEEVFDKSLDTALRVSIGQSSYVNVFPKRRVAEALRRMKKQGVQRIDGAIGREIAEREGIKALLLPGISGVAGTYVLSASIEDPKTGTSFKAEITRAQRKEEVLDALDKLAGLIRRDLGESIGAISRQGRPLAKVTTSSLEALKQYSMGSEFNRMGKFGEARTCYDNALAIDPDFAAAKASLGMLHCEAAQFQEMGAVRFEGIDAKYGEKLLGEAVGQVENLPERERYGIQTFYARMVENDLPKAIQHLKAGVVLYPDDSAIRNNLGWFYKQMGRLDESMAEYKEALRIDPDLMLSYDGLNSIYLYSLGRVSDALALCKAQLERNDGYWQAHANLGWAWLGKGDLEQARRAFDKAVELNPKSTLDLFRLAHTCRLQKDYPKSLEALRRIPVADPSQSIDYDLGVIYQLMNERVQARRHFELGRLQRERDARANPQDFAYHIVLAVVQTRLGQNAVLHMPDGRGTPLNADECFLLGNFYAVQGKTDQAMQQLELAVEKGWSNYVFLKIHPDLANLYAAPRFQALLAKVLK